MSLREPGPRVPASSHQPIADVVSGRIVVPAIHLRHLGTVEMHGDSCARAWVPYPVDAFLVGQDGRGPISPAPHQLPDLPQTGMAFLQAVVEALVALFEHGAHGAAISSPGGVVVDLRSGFWRPDEDLQGVGAILAVAAKGYVPVLSPSRSLQERRDVRAHEGSVSRYISQEGGGFLQGQLCGKVGELLKFGRIQCG